MILLTLAKYVCMRHRLCAFTFTIPKCTVTKLKFSFVGFNFPWQCRAARITIVLNILFDFAVFFSSGMCFYCIHWHFECGCVCVCFSLISSMQQVHKNMFSVQFSMDCHPIQQKSNFKHQMHFKECHPLFSRPIRRIAVENSESFFLSISLKKKLQPHKIQNMPDNHSPFRQIYFTLICLCVSFGEVN